MIKDTFHKHIQLLQSWRRVCGFHPQLHWGLFISGSFRAKLIYLNFFKKLLTMSMGPV